MRDDPRLNQIALARQAVLAEGVELTDALVSAWLDRTWIVQSWRRCLARGARPEAPVVFDAVPRHAGAHAADMHATCWPPPAPSCSAWPRKSPPSATSPC